MRRESGELIKHHKEKGNGAGNGKARINGVGMLGKEGLSPSNWEGGLGVAGDEERKHRCLQGPGKCGSHICI